jgi:hypothetical protein
MKVAVIGAIEFVGQHVLVELSVYPVEIVPNYKTLPSLVAVPARRLCSVLD